MAQQAVITETVKIFLNRMVPHMAAGLSLEDSGRAVLADDERLWLVAGEKSEVGQAIRDGICERVYSGIRAATRVGG